MKSGKETSLNAKTYNYLLWKKYFSSLLWISKERLILTALTRVRAAWLMSSENCNDHLPSRIKQLFRFLGLKEIKKLNYLIQMLVPTNWTELVHIPKCWFSVHALSDNESFAPSSLAAATCSYSCLESNATTSVRERERELGLVTFGLVKCGNPSPSLYRTNYTIIALIKTVPSERWHDWST